MSINYANYSPDWQQIRARILDRAHHKCEGSPRYPDCRAENYKPHPVTGSKVILTIAHFDHDITNNEDTNLFAWCQRCHLTHDNTLHKRHATTTRWKKRKHPNQGELFS